MTKLRITGMTCQNCVKHVTQALKAVPGVSDARVDLGTSSAEVDGNASTEALVEAVEEEGYEAQAVT